MSILTLNSAGLSPDQSWMSDRWGKHIFWNIGIERVLVDQRSPYQHIQVLDTKGLGRMLVLDGNIQCAEGDEAGYHELLVHTGLCRAAAQEVPARRVLVIGGGDGGAAREALRHRDVVRVDLVDIDAAVTTVAKECLPGIWTHPEGGPIDKDERLRIFHRDGLQFLEESDERYDLVVVDASDCVGPGTVLYSERFYHAIRARLSEVGAVSVQAGSFWYLPEVLVSVVHGLRQVFPRVDVYQCFTAVYPGGIWNLAMATLGDDPRQVDEARAGQLQNLQFYDAATHPAAFVLPPMATQIIERSEPGDPAALEALLQELMQ